MLKTPKEIAQQYGFSVSYIRRMINKGLIKAEKVGKCYAINTDNLHSVKRRRKPKKTDKDSSDGSNK